MLTLPGTKWFFGAAIVLLPITSTTVVLMAQAQVARTASNIEALANESQLSTNELTFAAAGAPDRDDLARSRADVDARRNDAKKSAAVVAELTAACQRAGASVESVRPLQMPGAASNSSTLDSAQLSELIVRADCGTLGRLLDDIRASRLPLRVNAVNVSAEERGPDRAFGALRGVITVETWRPAPTAKKEAQP